MAAAIAVHGRVTGVEHGPVLAHWVTCVATFQTDASSDLLFQRFGADGRPHDAPRGSGTASAAYFAGFGAIREYADGHEGSGDIDSGPVLLGVSVSATGFALGPARAFGRSDVFERIYRTADLFGLPDRARGRMSFATGGPIGNALLFAMLTSGPEVAR